MKTQHLYSSLTTTLKALSIQDIPEDRKKVLQPLIDFIQDKVNQQQAILLNFICTHNSRRSLFSQVWAQAMATYFGIDDVVCYSGGTEATALYPLVLNTLEKEGFTVQKISEGSNPVYSIKYNDITHPVIGFSKKYEHTFNPTSHFAAIMTCSQADSGCPFIAGAEKRIPITYEDPKIFDTTEQQLEKYSERSTQIASEMKYVFASIH